MSNQIQETAGYCMSLVQARMRPLEYIGGMFPKGKLSMLVADTGKGKSYCLIGASLALTSGISFLPTQDYQVRFDGKVLVTETEGRISAYDERIRLSGGNINHYFTAQPPFEIAVFSVEKDKQRIERTIADQGIELWIVDSFSGFSNVDENTCQVFPCLQWFVSIAQKYNVAVVVTHLVNKSEKESRYTTRSVRGFSGITQFPELIWALDDVGDTTKRLYQIKNNIRGLPSPEYRYTVDPDNPGFNWVTVGEAPKSKIQVRKQLLADNPDLTPRELAVLLHKQEPQTTLESLYQWAYKQSKKAALVSVI